MDAEGVLFANVKSVSVVHDHPLGSTEPSHTDKKAMSYFSSQELLDIPILDHVIVSSDSMHFSLRNNSFIVAQIGTDGDIIRLFKTTE